MTTKQWLSIVVLNTLGLVWSGPVGAAAEPAAEKADKPGTAAAALAEPAVARQDHIRVRGQASLNSEVVALIMRGQVVTVLEDINHKKAKPDEPSHWYRVSLPTNASVWVNSDYIDKTTHTVRPKLLNLRGGPGENYSVLGRLERGATVTVLSEKASWLKIEPPSTASGFVAAHLLIKEPAAVAAALAAHPAPTAPKVAAAAPVAVPPAPVAEVKSTEPAPVVATTVVTNPAPVVTANEPPAVPAPPTAPPATTNAAVPVTPPPPAPPAVAVSVPPADLSTVDTNQLPTPPPELLKRVITREGLLKGTFSVQAPSYYELRSIDNNRLIDYIWSPSTNIVLKSYKGKRVFVTGEELLDERWPQTPVITVDAITVAQ
jgi:uncharacterized protein YgiM (DUF1202 family)